MAKRKQGIVERLLMGKEKSEGYARASLPSNRWELFWDILKGRLGKLILINLLVMIFFLPLVAIYIFRYISTISMGASYPFSASFGIGYMGLPSMVGAGEQIIVNANLYILLFLPVAFAIAAVGIAGGAYVMRNMVWTEGIFVANDFWAGIKKNIKQILIMFLLYSVFFYTMELTTSLCDYIIAIGKAPTWLMIMCKVISYFLMIILTIMLFHGVTMSVTYELTFRKLIKNSFLFTIGLAPQNIFFIFICLIPILLIMLGSFFMFIGITILIFLGFSLMLLIWTNFCQWAYDKFINDKVKGAQKNRGIYEKVKESDATSVRLYKEQLLMARANSTLSNKPIKPITDDEIKLEELHEGFTRADIAKLNESKQAIYDDNERYIEEHKHEFENLNEEQKKQKEELAKYQDERAKRIERAKQELKKHNKKHR